MSTETIEQLALDEVVITDTEAEDALEDRHRAAAALKPVRQAYKAADEAAKFAVARHPIPPDGAVRIGRFRITNRVVAGNSVAFDTEERTQLDIKTLDAPAGGSRPPKKAVATTDEDGRADGYQQVH